MSEVVTRPAANAADRQAVCGTDDEPTARVCFMCGEAKPLNEFAKDRRRRQGRRGVCAVCAGRTTTASGTTSAVAAGTATVPSLSP
jgi:hypothetical protein